MNKFELKNYNVGSTQPLLRQSDLKKIKFLNPLPNITLEFEKQSNSVFNKIKLATGETKTLTKLRDTLLPKLISGKIKGIK